MVYIDVNNGLSVSLFSYQYQGYETVFVMIGIYTILFLYTFTSMKTQHTMPSLSYDPLVCVHFRSGAFYVA